MSEFDLVLRGGTIVSPREGVLDADIAVRDGRIAALAAPGTPLDSAQVRDVSGLHVFPGVLDPHAHIGMGGGLEAYGSDTGSAALGGVTSVLNILIHQDAYVPEVERHRAAADGAVHTDYGLHLTLMTPEHLAELPRLGGEFGVTSFKYYMSFRGEEGAYLGIPGTDDGVMFDVMGAVRDHGGVLAVHPENIEIVWRLRERLQAAGRDDLRAWDESRPPFVEAEAVYRAAQVAIQVGCPLYFVHLSGEEPVEAVRRARRAFPEGAFHAETCPHFLTHHKDMDLGSLGKVNPPLRSPSDVEALWRAVADGTIDTVGSDHVGRRLESKEGPIWTASAGFPGMASILPVLLTYGHVQRQLPLWRIARLTSLRPAEIFGLADRKGDVRVGLDADLAVVDLGAERTMTAADLGTWADYSLYDEVALRGWPKLTYLRGQLVQEDGALVAPEPTGRYLPRTMVPADA